MQDRIGFSLTFVALLLLVSGSGPVAIAKRPAPTYRIIDLGTLGGSFSYAYGINARGQVVGYSITAAGLTHAFLWDARTGIQDLGTLGGDYSFATGINARSQVVGYSSPIGYSPWHAFLWDASTGMQDLGTLGGDYSSAAAINARGQIVGSSLTATGRTHAFLWDARAGMRDLGTLGGDYSAAAAINARGQIVGSSSPIATGVYPWHAFLWNARTGMQDLGTLVGDFSAAAATGINTRGEVVGYSERRVSPFQPPLVHAILWEAGTGIQDLDISSGGFSSATATGINARGQIVGYSNVTGAFLWEAGTGIKVLGTLVGARSSAAYGINARGQVVGSSGTAEGFSHAVLWEPDSEQENEP